MEVETVLGSSMRVLTAVLLGGLVVGSMGITRYLRLLEEGITQNELGVRQSIVAQRAIQEHNRVLPEMVLVSHRIGQGLDRVILASETISAQIERVDQANLQTLDLNAILEQNNAAATQELVRVVEALARMTSSSAAINTYLIGVKEIVEGDVDSLRAIAANTARMNLRTPGVIPR